MLRWSLYVTGYLFAITLVGLVGVLLLGGLEHPVRRWGWVAGALFAAAGYPLGWVRLGRERRRESPEAEQPAETPPPGPLMGRLRACLLGLLLGVVVGFPASIVPLVVWVSLALSPLTPDGWREGFTVGWCYVGLPLGTAFTILGWTTGGFALLGLALGLTGKWSHGASAGGPGC